MSYNYIFSMSKDELGYILEGPTSTCGNWPAMFTLKSNSKQIIEFREKKMNPKDQG